MINYDGKRSLDKDCKEDTYTVFAPHSEREYSSQKDFDISPGTCIDGYIILTIINCFLSSKKKHKSSANKERVRSEERSLLYAQ